MKTCLAGDFNAVVDIKKDYTSNKKEEKKNIAKYIFEMVQELHLQDIWRHLNLKENQYTFYSIHGRRLI